ncbi:Putative type I restriction enzyme specificity protein MPN_638 [Chromobacterium violaceum]|uniref:Type I restriction enzyme specificity protein MPN_638 n=1 Tax=Chromobacterium violaceum TaxID=536 RepID=A0A3S4HNR6_CHRVL|nr:Putative type I restriction enzyme specificity protein MPN_638 [Chromobacterium violaceum]
MSFDSELPNGWYWSILDDVKAVGRSVVSGPFGSNIGKRFFVESGVPVIRGNNLTTGMDRFNDNGFVFLTEEKAKEFTACEAVAGDLIFTAAGTIGQVGIIPKDAKYQKYIISNKQLRARLDSEKIDPTFAFYWFASPTMVQTIQSRNTGSTIPLINLSVLKSLPIPVPPLKEQRVIAEYLSTLDERITLLRETNATLEAIAQALFKSWFVDFDPVRAKMEGRAPEGMDEATAALFPDGFEESELGLVPRGWRACSFTDTIRVIGGGTPKTSVNEYWNGTIPWFSVVDAPSPSDVFVVDTEKHITEKGLNNSSTKILAAGTTIISARGTVGKLALAGNDMAMNQSCYGLRGIAGDNYFTYFSTHRLVETLKQRTHGSVFDTITRDTLAGVSVVYPSESVINTFESFLSPIMARIKENLGQAQSLASLRDTLLPRLISGQLRLPEAEALTA